MIGKCIEQRAHIPCRHRLPIVEALSEFAAYGAEIIGIGLGLHAFGNHFLAELVRECHDRAQDQRGLVVDRAVMHERLVDLDDVERETVQIAE